MTGHTPWAKVRELRAGSAGHHTPGYLEAHPMAPSPASLPQPDLRASVPVPVPPEVAAEPEKIVRCGNCNAMGPSSLIPDVPFRGPRCADHDACTDRWYTGKPVSLLPHVAEALEPLPEDAPAPAVRADITDAPGDVMRTWAPPAYAQEAVDRHLAARGEGDAAEPEDAADAAEQAATEALARWAPGETLTEDEEPEAPHSQADVTYLIPDEDMIVAAETPERAEEAAQALAEHPGPDEQGFGEPEPAPVDAEETEAPDSGDAQ